MRPGQRRGLDKADPIGALVDKVERLKASVRVKVKPPSWMIKPQFDYAKVRYQGLVKNTGGG